MNSLIEKISNLRSGETLLLEKNAVYNVYDDDCVRLTGIYCSNTTTKEENPTDAKKTAIFLQNKKNVTINGNGATVLVHGILTPVIFLGCENITLKNLTIDYARPTMSEFTVLENRHGECVLEISEESLFEIENGSLCWVGERKADGSPRWKHAYKADDVLSMYFSPEEKKLRFLKREAGDKFPSVPAFSRVEKIGARMVLATLKNKEAFLPEGAVIQTRRVTRDEIGGFFNRCKNCVFEGLRVAFFHGLGLLSQHCENITFLNCDFTPSRGRTFSSNADLLHFSGCKGKIVIKNCKSYGTHDDFINVHGTHLKIVAVNEKQRRAIVRFANPNSRGFQAFSVGDTIEFIRRDTLLPYHRTKVLRFSKLNDTDVELTLSALPHKTAKNGVCALADAIGDAVYNYTQNPRVLIENNYFGYCAARGVLCTTRKKAVIRGNVFENIAGAALLIEDDCNFWYESGYTKNVIFKNNKVIDCGFENGETNREIAVTPKVLSVAPQKSVHGKLTITDNKFYAPTKKHEFLFEHIRRVISKRNFFNGEHTTQFKK